MKKALSKSPALLDAILWKSASITLLLAMTLAGTAQQKRVGSSQSEALISSAKADADIAVVETADRDDRPRRKDLPYLGVSTSEVSAALRAQLGLKPGAGLVVTYVAVDSPAAKAGLEKHDVLVEFGEQLLVHPAQLRKLVQIQKEGDEVKLVYYRGGKRQTAKVTLGKTSARISREQERSLQGALDDLETESNDLDSDIHERLHNSLRTLHIDRQHLHRDIHHRMDDIRTTIHQALRDVTNVASHLDPIKHVLREINRSGVHVDNNATVTVRSAGNRVKTVVKADDSGTIVLIEDPKPHLTAHDKKGELLFDGDIDTEQQRAKVPEELWERVKPLLEK